VSFRRFFLVRLAWALVALFVATVVVFSTFRLLAARPPPTGGEQDLELERSRILEPYFDRDRLFLIRYGEFLKDFLNDGSLGRSISTGGEPRSVALEAAPATGSLVLPGLALALGLALPFSLLWGSPRKRLWRIPVYLAVGALPIWVGLWLSLYPGVHWGWFPVANYCDVFNPSNACGGVGDWARHLVLPWITFALFFAAVYARGLLRVIGGVRAAKEEDRRDLIRYSALGVVRMVGRDVGFAVGLAAFVEVTFQIPGLGRALFTSVYSYDFPLAETVLLWVAVFGVAAHFLVDVIAGALDANLRAEWPFVYSRAAGAEST
jgi:peptide/nickel transport system permease protein